jgi:hypothetical protein
MPLPSGLPTKKQPSKKQNFGGQFGGQKGWIEYPLKGTKNPKRYAYRRQWQKVGGQWVKTAPIRMKSIDPLTQEEYVKAKRKQEQAKSIRSKSRLRSRSGG